MAEDTELQRPLWTAVAGTILWIVIEVIARRRIGPVFARAINDDLAGDMLVSLIELPTTTAIVARIGAANGFEREVLDYRWTPKAILVGVGAGLAGLVSIALTTVVDSTLFGGIDNTQVVTDETSTPAEGLLLGVNGVVGPTAEEFVWRGIIQTALVERFDPLLGIGLTSTVFALKHVVVDRSVERLTTLLTLGVVFGVVRHRLGTGASTATHITANLIGSIGAVVAQRTGQLDS